MPKVDMSPEAVTQRLRLMGELCEEAMKARQSQMNVSAESDSEDSATERDEELDRRFCLENVRRLETL